MGRIAGPGQLRTLQVAAGDIGQLTYLQLRIPSSRPRIPGSPTVRSAPVLILIDGKVKQPGLLAAQPVLMGRASADRAGRSGRPPHPSQKADVCR